MRPMEPAALAALLPFGLMLLALLSRSVRQINQWETGLKFRLGKFVGRMEPGLHLMIPIVTSMMRIDTRIRNRDLPAQMVITADSVTVMIDAVVYYRVVDPEKAALNVENYELAIKDRAKVVLRDIVGETTLDNVLEHREEISAKVRVAVEQFVAQWGLHVELIALQDIQLPPAMQEVIAKRAIAERDRQYVIIKSQADVESARNFAEAARILSSAPGAMELRRLEALQNLSHVGTNKVIFDLAKPYTDIQQQAAAMSAAVTDEQRTGVRVDPAALTRPVVHQTAEQANPALTATVARQGG